jgi:hypothetical protein
MYLCRCTSVILVNYLAMASVGYLSFCGGVMDNVVVGLALLTTLFCSQNTVQCSRLFS